jgi:transketolase
MTTKSLRTAYGETLVELGKENNKIVALEADLGKSTMSNLFQQAFPDRYFEMGIAEQNMASTAAGLSLTGKIPFISSFAIFASGRD